MKLQREVSVQADRLDKEYDLLERMLDQPLNDETEPDHAKLLTQQAKRVRKESNLLVRATARLRDYLQPKEAQG